MPFNADPQLEGVKVIEKSSQKTEFKRTEDLHSIRVSAKKDEYRSYIVLRSCIHIKIDILSVRQGLHIRVYISSPSPNQLSPSLAIRIHIRPSERPFFERPLRHRFCFYTEKARSLVTGVNSDRSPANMGLSRKGQSIISSFLRA